MEKLKERILREGKSLPGDILKVDSFLNHQIDVKTAEEIGNAFYHRFRDRPVTKILTIESGGIIFACETARAFGYLPVVYGKKGYAANMDEDTFAMGAHSYTRQSDYVVRISKEYLNREDHVLIIDDFLANGEAMTALIALAEQAGAVIEGCGAVVEKSYQPGRKRILELGYEVETLVRISSLENGRILFEETEE
ncbi:MAG: xanthine phosphoribosyltransferase [Solobacterium sp.]|nr:xanthine phosphoribosyltransferase [Solobacterium sp.]